MAGMARKEIARLLDHIEPQGVSVTRTTKGVLLRLPDDTTTMLHFSGSDVREPKNVRARLKRAGVSWPGEESPLPQWIAERPTQRTLDRVQAVLATYEHRYITGGQLSRLLVAAGDKPMNSMVTQRALYHLGWVATGKSTGRKWLRPLELEPDPFAEEAAELAAAAEAEAAAAEAEAEAKAEAKRQLELAAHNAAAEPVHLEPKPERSLSLVPDGARPAEVQPTDDSWAISLDTLPNDLNVTQLWVLLQALGLQGEIRVRRDAPGGAS